MTGVVVNRPVSVQELRRAWHAVQAGQFRGRPDPLTPPGGPGAGPGVGWVPAERVLVVVGCVGQAGASTLALALATVAGPARVIECAPASASALTAAATAELGASVNGWALGRREQVSIARTIGMYLAAGELPVPDEAPPGTTVSVVDVGWELGQVLAGTGWLRHTVADAPTVVAVTAPTVPGLRRLENALTLLGAERTVIAVVGAPRRRWPPDLTAAMGPHTRTATLHGRLVRVPADRQLAERGVDAAPLPAALLQAAATLLQYAAPTSHHQNGHPT